MIFSNEAISEIKNKVKETMSDSRYLHTLGVREAACCLYMFCFGESSFEIEAAALFHDITKEYSIEDQLQVIKKYKENITEEDVESPQILHAFTAKFEIMEKYPEFATENILSAVYNHTVGAPDMSVFDEIIFLADFIEYGREYFSSKELRKYVFENMKIGQTNENIKILHRACIRAIDYTVLHLIECGKRINSKNILTRNALLSKI